MTTPHKTYEEGDTITFTFDQIIRATKTAEVALTQEEVEALNECDDQVEYLVSLVENRTKADLCATMQIDVDYDRAEEEDFTNFEIVEE